MARSMCVRLIDCGGTKLLWGVGMATLLTDGETIHDIFQEKLFWGCLESFSVLFTVTYFFHHSSL